MRNFHGVVFISAQTYGHLHFSEFVGMLFPNTESLIEILCLDLLNLKGGIL